MLLTNTGRLRTERHPAHAPVVRETVDVVILGELGVDERAAQRLVRLNCRVIRLDASASRSEVINALRLARFVIFNNFDINPYLEYLQSVDLVVLAATGYSFVNISDVRRFQVRMTNLNSYSIPAVVEYMIHGAFEGLRRLDAASRRVASGDWRKNHHIGKELAASNAGVVGYGRIGKALAKTLQCLGTSFRVNSRETSPSRPANWVPLKELTDCDVLFVCCSLTDGDQSSRCLISGEVLDRVPPEMTLVSVSPNEVLDLDAVANWLLGNPQSTAILDLDPIEHRHLLFECPNALITPHTAFLTHSTLQRRTAEAIDRIEASLSGQSISLL